MLDSPIRVSRHHGTLDALAPEWARLADEQHPGAAFRTPAWLAAWWRHATPNGAREPHVLLAHAGGELCGILPLYAAPGALGERRLRLMGDGIVGSDYQGAIARPEHAAVVARAFAAHLARAGAALDLDDLDDGDPLLAACDDWLGDRADRVERYLCPHVRIGADFDDYLRRLPDGTGAQWHRRRKWLERFDDYRIDELRAPDDVERGLGVLFELHRQRWALEGGSDAIDGPRVETFHRAAGRALAELGWARVYVMHADGAPRAALYGFRHGDRFVFYQAGHEPAWRPRSVGTVLLGSVIRQCFTERIGEFDFLRGSEPYKLKWANGARHTVSLRARGLGLRARISSEGRAIAGELRAFAKRVLPESALEWVRARRRRLARVEGGAA
ncbi:MAG TPA: GNAT family N-acetyltransferase [Polyangia bacterium]|nr:GNAT family N-acetyltransferase [Polyangia bacterium]